MIHTRKLSVADGVNFKKLVSLTEGATGADIKAICTEAGMFAIRKDADIILEEDFVEASSKVLNKIKDNLQSSGLYA